TVKSQPCTFVSWIWHRLDRLPPFSEKNSTCWSISRFGNLLSSPSRYLNAARNHDMDVH
ncbi:hypothetical protein L9F63_016334, partial [Diploptera punctata]